MHAYLKGQDEEDIMLQFICYRLAAKRLRGSTKHDVAFHLFYLASRLPSRVRLAVYAEHRLIE